MPERLHLLPKHRVALETLIEKHLPGVEVWAYGSRVNGRSHDGSDLDLVLRGPELKEIPIERLADFEEALRESTIPFLVEARDWARLPKRFQCEIERKYEVLAEMSKFDRSAWSDHLFSEAVTINPPVRLQRGHAYPYVDMALLTPGFRSVRTSNLREYRGGGSRFEAGDTLMARITPCLENGKTSRFDPIDIEGCRQGHGSTEFIVLRGRQNISDTDYVHYLAKSPEVRNFAISQMTGTSGRQRVPFECFNHLLVTLPPIPEQRTIARFLSELDDKIELNRRMNKTLGAVARAIFKDWFVDFGPTRAKVEGRAPYLPQDLWRLFPDELDNENKPMGWRVAPLTELAEVNPESWWRKNAPAEVDYVDLANTKWGTIEATQRFLWKDAPSRARRILRPGDTIVGLVRPGNGSFAFIGSEGLTGSTGFAVLRPRHSRFTQLVNLNATAPENIERLANLADGAAYPAIRPEVVGATQVVVPDDAVATRFSELVSPILNHMESNKRENHTLAQTRDLLLPKLMSGEIRLRDAEKNVEAIT